MSRDNETSGKHALLLYMDIQFGNTFQQNTVYLKTHYKHSYKQTYIWSSSRYLKWEIYNWELLNVSTSCSQLIILDAQLFLQPKLIPHKDRSISIIKMLSGLSTQLTENSLSQLLRQITNVYKSMSYFNHKNA